MWVKKSLKDPTAALSYSLSVSILHLAMVIGLVLVERPNVEAAKKINKYCEKEAMDLEDVLTWFLIAHIMSFFATGYREMYSAKTDLFGQMMRIIEVICIPALLKAILHAIEMTTVVLVRIRSVDKVANSHPKELTDAISGDKSLSIGQRFLWDKCRRDDFRKYNGRAFEWILIEVMVFAFFLFSMVILMFKSRFMKVGIDNSAQFEPVYMRILAQKIAESIPLQIEYAE